MIALLRNVLLRITKTQKDLFTFLISVSFVVCRRKPHLKILIGTVLLVAKNVLNRVTLKNNLRMTKNLKDLLKPCLDQRLKISDTVAQTVMYCGDLNLKELLGYVTQFKIF